MKLSDTFLEAVYKECERLYSTDGEGIQSIITLCEGLGFSYNFCGGCEAEMPVIKTTDYECCAVCGS